MTNDKPLAEINREGLAALRERLGVAGMVRFLQQFELGTGDYTKERRAWVEQLDMEQLQSARKKTRARARKTAV